MKLDILPGKSFTAKAGENIDANSLVVFGTAGAIFAAADTDRPRYVIYDAVSTGGYVAIYPLEGRALVLANTPIALGSTVQCAGGGKAEEVVSVVAASTTLTSTGVAPTAADTVTLGDETYTFVSALSAGPTVPFEVLIGISAATALDNLLLAVNAVAASVGVKYSTGTTQNADILAGANADTTQLFIARVPGAAGNALVSTKSAATLSFPAVTFATPGTGVDADPDAIDGLTFGVALTAAADTDTTFIVAGFSA